MAPSPKKLSKVSALRPRDHGASGVIQCTDKNAKGILLQKKLFWDTLSIPPLSFDFSQKLQHFQHN